MFQDRTKTIPPQLFQACFVNRHVSKKEQTSLPRSCHSPGMNHLIDYPMRIKPDMDDIKPGKNRLPTQCGL